MGKLSAFINLIIVTVLVGKRTCPHFIIEKYTAITLLQTLESRDMEEIQWLIPSF